MERAGSAQASTLKNNAKRQTLHVRAYQLWLVGSTLGACGMMERGFVSKLARTTCCPGGVAKRSHRKRTVAPLCLASCALRAPGQQVARANQHSWDPRMWLRSPARPAHGVRGLPLLGEPTSWLRIVNAPPRPEVAGYHGAGYPLPALRKSRHSWRVTLCISRAAWRSQRLGSSDHWARMRLRPLRGVPRWTLAVSAPME